MSAASSKPPPSSSRSRVAAPWKSLFLSHLSQAGSAPEFVLATLHPATDDSGSSAPTPRARYCIYRGMWAELPPNQHNTAPRNKSVYESDLPTFTTDVRMAKVSEFSGGSSSSETTQGSGGGGQVEAVFWVKDVMTQWRFRGEAFVVGPDIEGEGSDSNAVELVKQRVGDRMRIVEEEGRADWSWHKEVTAHFGNLNPGMRGSFKNPVPGSLISVPPANKELALGQKVDDLEDPVARENFRVCIIKPHEVEQLDLTAPEKARRWRYTYVGPTGGEADSEGEGVSEWKKEELWP